MGSQELFITWDENGHPWTLQTGGQTYWYVTNLQGDVTAILNGSGDPMVTYSYDAWGNILEIGGEDANTLGRTNPLRYRGYVYDQETGLYYLQSRYYDPEMGRFICADPAYIATGQDLTGNNRFAYCGNNPVVCTDYAGTRYCAATTVDKESSYDRFISCDWQEMLTMERYNPKPIGKTSKGNVYLVKDLNDIKVVFPGDVVVRDCTDTADPSSKALEVRYSWGIIEGKQIREVVSVLAEWGKDNQTGWYRTETSMVTEWNIHNLGAYLGGISPKVFELSKHVCLDNRAEGWGFVEHLWDAGRKVFG